MKTKVERAVANREMDGKHELRQRIIDQLQRVLDELRKDPNRQDEINLIESKIRSVKRTTSGQVEGRDTLAPLTSSPVDVEGAVFRGYGATFGNFSVDLGGFVEVIRPGAFRKALSTSDPVLLLNHDSNFVLARRSAGTFKVWEDDHGLRFEAKVAPSSVARNVAVHVGRGDFRSCSFSFSLAAGGDRFYEDAKLGTFRELREIARLNDVSIVTNPAYRSTSVKITSRAVEDAIRQQRITTEKQRFKSQGYCPELVSRRVAYIRLTMPN